MEESSPQSTEVAHASGIAEAGQLAMSEASAIGFDETTSEELKLVARELAANLVCHAGQGMLTVTRILQDSRPGIAIETTDLGPGISDVRRALENGVSTGGGLGYGLGTVDRLCDEVEIFSPLNDQGGTHVIGRRWLPQPGASTESCPLSFGVATRPYPGMQKNGDAFIVRRLKTSALVGAIDGLGHGPPAHLASSAARHYIERHADQSLTSLVTGASRACQPTRGAVVALARIDWIAARVSHVGVGNIETRLFVGAQHLRLASRPGIVGRRGPALLVEQHSWGPGAVLVLHSDGLSKRWTFEDFPRLWAQPCQQIARDLLQALDEGRDDATVVVAKGAES